MVEFHVEKFNFKDVGNRILQTPSNMVSSITGSIFVYKPPTISGSAPAGLNADGSGVIREQKDGEVVESYYGIGHVLEKRITIKRVNSNGKDVTVTYEESGFNVDGKQPSMRIVTVTDEKGDIKITKSNFEYDKDGNLKAEKRENLTKSADGKIKNDSHKTSDITYTMVNGKPKISHSTTSQKKCSLKKTGSSFILTMQNTKTETDYEYNSNGTLSKRTVSSTDSAGKPVNSTFNYDGNEKIISAQRTFYSRGAKTERYYSGVNINNRYPGVPDKEVVYEQDGVTVAHTIVNKFDNEGILIGREEFDKNNKKVNSYDFSMPDGKIGTSFQGGTGDCYLLAAINGLVSSENGRKLLEQNIKISADTQGKKTYTISLPGAKIAREELIKKGIPADKISIQDSYTITEEELHKAMLQAGKKFSVGDKDVLLLEIVYEKYRKDVTKTVKENKLETKDLVPGLIIAGNEQDAASLGFTHEATFILTGISSVMYKVRNGKDAPTCFVDSNFQMHVIDKKQSKDGEKAYTPSAVSVNTNNSDMHKYLDELAKDSADNGRIDSYSATASFNVSTQEVNGQEVKGGGHAFTILKVTDNKVILANPWAPDTPVVMSRADFERAVVSVTSSPISGTVTPQPSSNTRPPERPNTNTHSHSHVTTPTRPNRPATSTGSSHLSTVQNLQPDTDIKVPKNQGYKALIRQALINQGINPTPENMRKAQAQFDAANQGKVHVYKGSKKEWRGNKYLIANSTVHIPKFDIK